MPKPLTTGGMHLTQVYGSVAEELKRRIGDAQAAQAGPPTSEEIVPSSEELQVKAWNERNPAATDEAMQQLAAQKYQEHVQSGMPPDVAQRATAEDLTHFRYGNRLKLYTYGQTDFAEQVAEAKRLAKLAARENTPDPPLPPPTMPSAALTNLTAMGAPLPETVVQPSSTPGAGPPLPGGDPLSGVGQRPPTPDNGLPEAGPGGPPPPEMGGY
jgi:hypothetical protein